MYLRKLAALLVVCIAAAPVTYAGLILNFDDLPNSTAAGAALPSDYYGFTWEGDWRYMSDAYYVPGIAPTAPNFVYSADGGPGTIARTDGATFDFEGAYFSAWAGRLSASVTVQAWDGSVLVGTEVFSGLNPSAFNFQSASLNNVDRLVFINDGTPGDLWLMDGFSDALHVPVPRTDNDDRRCAVAPAVWGEHASSFSASSAWSKSHPCRRFGLPHPIRPTSEPTRLLLGCQFSSDAARDIRVRRASSPPLETTPAHRSPEAVVSRRQKATVSGWQDFRGDPRKADTRPMWRTVLICALHSLGRDWHPKRHDVLRIRRPYPAPAERRSSSSTARPRGC